MKVWTAIASMVVFSTIPSSFMCYVAWQHNPQGEVVDNSVINYWYLTILFGSWWVLSICVLTPFLLVWIFLCMRKRRKSQEGNERAI